MDVNPGYIYIEKIRGGIQWYMMESKYFISSNSFKKISEKKVLVSSNGQTFRLSMKEI